jgi:hypothetical protein
MSGVCANCGATVDAETVTLPLEDGGDVLQSSCGCPVMSTRLTTTRVMSDGAPVPRDDDDMRMVPRRARASGHAPDGAR